MERLDAQDRVADPDPGTPPVAPTRTPEAESDDESLDALFSAAFLNKT
jgi:hypothetical protein